MMTSEGSGLLVGNNLAHGLSQSKQEASKKPLDWQEDGGSQQAKKPSWADEADQEGDDPRLQRC